MELRIRRLKDNNSARDDLRYWLARPPAERIAAVEALRRDHPVLGEAADAEPRLQRVCRVVQRPRG